VETAFARQLERELAAAKAKVEALRADAEMKRNSRGMFVTRLYNMRTQNNGETDVIEVLALLSDCESLVARAALAKEKS
jgi:hypothetical protein